MKLKQEKPSAQAEGDGLLRLHGRGVQLPRTTQDGTPGCCCTELSAPSTVILHPDTPPIVSKATTAPA